MTSLFDQLSMHEPSQLHSQCHQRRNAISIPERKSSLVHNYPSFDGKTIMIQPPPTATTTPMTTLTTTDAQMNKMKQLMCTAIHQLRTLVSQLADADEAKLHWQTKYADLEARHQRLMESHHNSLVALKTTRRLLLLTRRHEKLEHGRHVVNIKDYSNN